jgi:hypothetical protein
MKRPKTAFRQAGVTKSPPPQRSHRWSSTECLLLSRADKLLVSNNSCTATKPRRWLRPIASSGPPAPRHPAADSVSDRNFVRLGLTPCASTDHSFTARPRSAPRPLTGEDVVRRIAAEYAFISATGEFGIRIEPAAALMRQCAEPITPPAGDGRARLDRCDRRRAGCASTTKSDRDDRSEDDDLEWAPSSARGVCGLYGCRRRDYIALGMGGGIT